MDVLHAPQRSQTGPLDKCLIGDMRVLLGGDHIDAVTLRNIRALPGRNMREATQKVGKKHSGGVAEGRNNPPGTRT
jgi:hypothetical protein